LFWPSDRLNDNALSWPTIRNSQDIIFGLAVPAEVKSIRSKPELFDATDYSIVSICAFPNWNRVAPISVAGNIPIRCGLDTLLVSAMLEVLWVPIDFFVIGFEQSWFDFLDIHKPGRNCVVKKRRAATPAVRIRVSV
jgi:hypothetical protein